MSAGVPPPDPRAAVPPPLRLVGAIALMVAATTAAGWLLPAFGIADDSPLRTPIGFAAAAAAILAFAFVLPPGACFLPVAPLALGRRWLLLEVVWVPLMVGYLLAMRELGHAVPPQPELDALGTHGIGAGTWPIVVAAVLVAPVLEELLCRGYLLQTLRQWLPVWPAHLVTAASFGLLHGLPYALPIGLLGLGFGWIRERSGSLLPSMLAHALHNAAVVLVAVAWPAGLQLIYPR